MTNSKLLLFIDFQNVFCSDSGNSSDGIWPVPDIQNALKEALLFQRTNEFRMCIATKYIPPDPIKGAWIEYFKKYPKYVKDKSSDCYELLPNVPTDIVVCVPKFGKWSEIEQEHDLTGITDIYICGVSTDCCVLSTAISAIDAGYYVHVVANACAASTEEDHQRALELMKIFEPNLSIIF